ncbi:hypothetical protein QUA41_30745 [Microcoleus sp. Pol11C1]|uniref:hypothetical protein n=1 Tax=unclassified Microcoleus TaxID=2642155 RepID=UPI002FD2EC0C
MAQDVPAQIFFDQIGNTTVRAVLTGNTTLPSTISPSSFLLAVTDGLEKAQIIFNGENGSIPDVATVSGKELGQTVIAADGRIEIPIFYAVGGKLFVDPTNSDPIIL